MAITSVDVLIGALFLAVGVLLAYGARVFRSGKGEPGAAPVTASRVNMGREVLWTGISATLLLAIFLLAH